MVRFHLLHTNDLHSHFERVASLYSKITEFRNQWSEQGDPYLLVDAGDHMDRARFETEGTDGQINRLLLEQFAYDAITLGNNELLTFDKDQLNNLYQAAPFTILGSNLIDTQRQEQPSWCRRWEIFKRQQVTIGCLGVTVPFDDYYEQMGWRLDSPLETVAHEVSLLRSKVDLIIVLSHLGLAFDRQLAMEVKGIDIIVGGHTHHLLPKGEQCGDTLIVAAGKFGQFLGQVTIELDDQMKVQSSSAKCIEVEHDLVEPTIHKMLTHATTNAEQQLSETVVNLCEPLLIDWYQESTFANLLADSLADWTGAGLALVNNGQLLESLPQGDVTRQDLHRVCPHPINPVLLTLKGQVIRQTIEQSLYPEFQQQEIRGYGFRGEKLGRIAVSGFVVHLDGQFVTRIEADGQCLVDDQEYLVATIDMFTFGVGYVDLAVGKVEKIFMPEVLRDLLYDHLSKKDARKRAEVLRFR
ncbi:2',3'-cyclic-nucleotide 2'-phosphodiesterase/5'-or 3'-nucleotidase, 5'-nucleotidase family [Seinonella peptonophila]|uniref:2',3'-cyclic-nucleotide 2'-phosphodiesterase/5'-or 3'-nucleotidase, 5'-nucleotidase family n=1 Tax=Seinonella peptonophila TaxID=112248 RepID=A0A1M4ZFT7_9BACL|nr:bifunctional UDP-sugar hydrolase/5'-nucleotidase [Seinonella peptonophila]SHF16845.1 2',3'-cyclic-nucleotide 2'-phosphodiesterase/5'-or 3'-nucleotidase, 5'-nucleotidase family [Seinonella peptonophila]